MAISKKKKVVISKKLPNLLDVPESAPVVSKTKSKLPEIVTKKTIVKPEVKKVEKKTVSDRLYLNNPILDDKKIDVITIPTKPGKSTDFCKLYKSGMTIAQAKEAGVPSAYIKFHIYRGFIAYTDSAVKVFISGRKSSGEKKAMEVKGTSKIKLAMAGLKK